MTAGDTIRRRAGEFCNCGMGSLYRKAWKKPQVVMSLHDIGSYPPNKAGRRTWRLYSRGMNEAFFAELSAWLIQAGLAGRSETDIVNGFCDRSVAAGLPLARGQVFIDTLHPVHEGRLFRWGVGPTESPLVEYGRTDPDAL